MGRTSNGNAIQQRFQVPALPLKNGQNRYSPARKAKSHFEGYADMSLRLIRPPAENFL